MYSPSVIMITYSLLFRIYPQITDSWEQEVVETNITGDLPGEYQEYGDAKEDWVDTGRASHHEIPVHKTTKEGSEPDKDACNQSDTDHEFADGNKFCKPCISLGIKHILNKAAIPVIRNRRASFSRDFYCAQPETLQRVAGLHPGRAFQFMQTCFNPLPAEPYSHSQPKNGKAFVVEQQINERGSFERLTLAGENISGHY